MNKRAVIWMAVATAFATTGCVNGPSQGRPPSTPYKGDAIWNVSRAVQPMTQSTPQPTTTATQIVEGRRG
jgi:hypothetical protein